MTEKDKIVIQNIEAEIAKIDERKMRVYFFVIDTKGVPSGSLEYVYNLALILSKDGYDVSMLHTEDEFVGVGDWLGEEYTSLPHYNVNKGNVGTSPSDIVFIPELYSQVMNQTKNLPCKRVAIMQNYDYMVEQMPYAAQWGDFGIYDCIANTKAQADKLKGVFPYVRTKVIPPFISKLFGETSEPKNMVINVVAKDQSDIKRIVKPFYWKYPIFRWVSFKDLRGLPKTKFAEELRNGAVAIIVDDDASFMYSALEAMKSGAIVMCKIPNDKMEWAVDEEGNALDCCVWFDSFDTLHKQIASVVRSWTTDNVPDVVFKDSMKSLKRYSFEVTKREFLDYVAEILRKRKDEMRELITHVKAQADNGSKN